MRDSSREYSKALISCVFNNHVIVGAARFNMGQKLSTSRNVDGLACNSFNTWIKENA